MDCRTGKTLNPFTCVYVKDCEPGYVRNERFLCRKKPKSPKLVLYKPKSKTVKNNSSPIPKMRKTKKTVTKLVSVPEPVPEPVP